MQKDILKKEVAAFAAITFDEELTAEELQKVEETFMAGAIFTLLKIMSTIQNMKDDQEGFDLINSLMDESVEFLERKGLNVDENK